MDTFDFNYFLPPDRIAQRPVEPRDHSRLMVIDRARHTIEHRSFFDILDYLHAGDVVVWNNSKVFKARLFGQLLTAEGHALFNHVKQVEIFLVRPTENVGVWQVLAKPGRHVLNGTKVQFAPDFFCDVITKNANGLILVQFADEAETVRRKANQYGFVPIPPYVKDEVHELSVYQTVYAKHEGSVAAPTAGFHFTPALIEQAKQKGIIFAEVTLHIGLGTFLPVKTERVEDHTMHSEWVDIPKETTELIHRAKQDGRRIIAIGTTTARTLEGVAQFVLNQEQLARESQDAVFLGEKHPLIEPYRGDINLFIKPGFTFRIIDGLVTNFHLPKSTLLMLVSAFVGDREFVLDCYQKALAGGYRFYSFGDAMLIV